MLALQFCSDEGLVFKTSAFQGEQYILFPKNLNISRQSWGKDWTSKETEFTVPQRSSH